ncbi:pectate lyase [Novosphingobium resinovorum]|uniref:pectate lyase n=1 Tax=Novosphingobium TaxID=165696 RepID=UPI0020042DB6|nr:MULTISPECIES: pectate lyase [Novosphingobium]MBF7014202.1 pectate lyase [Novosphingobium sp. HR1a]WJM25322.1 pectate lyase [Novosphingobium resinovorum]
MRNLKALLLATTLAAAPLQAATIGTMTPAEPVTAARIDAMPAAQQQAWDRYLARSQALMAADKAALAAERKSHPASNPPSGPSGGGGMPMDKPSAWYAGAEARRIAATVVSFQTPAGGWGKNMDRSGPARLPGQNWVPHENLPANAREDIVSASEEWRYVGTIDNNATLDEMRFLARVQAQAPGKDGDALRASFRKGLGYLLEAQFPNGGWPQVYPLQGGYHDAVTYNDDAIAQVLALLGEVAARKGDFAFVTAPEAASARAAYDRGIGVILATQVRVGGRLTGWSQQHDALTQAPVGARNFEPAALSSNESARLLVLLMEQPSPSPQVVAAVHGGAAWLRSVAVRDKAWGLADDGVAGKRLFDKPGAGPIWARFYDMATGRPVFGDRDKSVHDEVNEISLERRNGYSWFGSGPGQALKVYETWAKGRE